jgi:hypothetical protein
MTSNPLIHVPLYTWRNAPDYAVHAMVEQHLTCLQSYFAHGNTYNLLVTTNDRRPFQMLCTYRRISGHRFDLRFITEAELLSVFKTDLRRLHNTPCVRTIFSKFFPILKRQADTIVHVDFDTLFLTKVDLSPLLVADITLVDANKFMPDNRRFEPLESQIDFFRLSPPVEPEWNWLNSGVFAVQRRGFQILTEEISHYLANLDRAIADGTNDHTDEIMMNALAVREPEAVTVIPDYSYNFIAYFLQHDPEWTTRAKIIHFHSVKPDKFWYVDGAFMHRFDDDEVRAGRVNEDLYLAVLLWFRHFHAACRGMPYRFPLLSSIPAGVVEREIRVRSGRARAESHGFA